MYMYIMTRKVSAAELYGVWLYCYLLRQCVVIFYVRQSSLNVLLSLLYYHHRELLKNVSFAMHCLGQCLATACCSGFPNRSQCNRWRLERPTTSAEHTAIIVFLPHTNTLLLNNHSLHCISVGLSRPGGALLLIFRPPHMSVHYAHNIFL